MAKQTFTTGQVLTAAQMTSLQQTAMLGGDANARTASYVLAASDAGNAVSMNSSSATTITVNTGIFAAGDIVTIINLGTGVCTITAGTATVATAATLALAQNEGGILRFTSASAAIFFEFATPQTGDITAVTAGTGLSGGGTSGDVTLTNTVATAFDAKGDLVVGTGADTFAKLTVGTNGHTLVADSSTATGLKWAAPTGGGADGWTLLNSGGTTLTGATTVTVSGLSAKEILILIANADAGQQDYITVRLNGDTGANYSNFGIENIIGNGYAADNFFKIASYSTNTGIQVARLSTNASSTVTGSIFVDLCDKTGWKRFSSIGAMDNFGGTNSAQYLVQGFYEASAAITSISVVSSGSNFSGGTVYVMGAN